MANRILVAICILSVGAMVSADIPSPLDYLTVAEQKEARDLIPAFVEIERYLSLNPTGRVQLFMNVYLGSKLSQLRSNSDVDHKRNKEATKLFLALPKATKMCNYEGYKILAQNRLAMEADQYSFSSKRSSGILRDFEVEHAEFCRGKYIIHPQESSKNFATAKQIIESLRSTDCSIADGIYDGLLKTSPICIKQLMGQLATVHKTKTGPSESDTLDLTWSALKDSLREYLIVPCRDYHEQYRTVFAPAIYDEQIVPAERGSFGAGLQDFKTCESIIRKEQALQHLMELEISQK